MYAALKYSDCTQHDTCIARYLRQRFREPRRPDEEEIIQNYMEVIESENVMVSRNVITCSRTSSLEDISKLMNIGTAPASITQRVWSEVPIYCIYINIARELPPILAARTNKASVRNKYNPYQKQYSSEPRQPRIAAATQGKVVKKKNNVRKS